MSETGLQPHLRIKRGDVGRYAFIPGDPGRVPRIAAYLESPQPVAYNREFNIYNGRLCGETVTVCSTGIGAPSASIAVEELIRCGVDTFIRIGTAGEIQEDLDINDVIIATGAVRDEGTTLSFAPLAYPAIADIDVVCALREGAEKLNLGWRMGIVQSKDAFYGQTAPDTLPGGPRLKYRWKTWIGGNVLVSEMEASSVLTLSSLRRCRAGCLFNTGGSMDDTIQTAIEALKILIQSDHQKMEEKA